MVRNAAQEDGFDLDYIPVDKSIKPVNIIILSKMCPSVVEQIEKGFPSLRMQNVEFNLNIEKTQGN